MKHKFLKSVVATFALVATLAVLPMAPSVEAAECDEVHCHHETLYLTKYDEDYHGGYAGFDEDTAGGN